MNNRTTYSTNWRKTISLTVLLFFVSVIHFNVIAQTEKSSLRRPISPEQPMWLIHIDTWNWADPQKIIDLIPEDIRPYAVFNISLSISHDENTGEYNIVEYGYETAKSWLRTCAANQVWAVIQPSSGGFSHFSDFDLSVYEEFYREYPNLIGFNYCEQFWGYDDKFSVTFDERLAHWANLMKLNQQYGGYLVVSFTGGFWGANLNPVAMLKRNADFEAICKETPEHFIMCEKFTMAYGFHDIESTCLGTYLSGYSGQYGIRFDECGWVATDEDPEFPVSAGAIPVMEHVMLTGQTVIDGPELIWKQCTQEISAGKTEDGYTTRQWDTFPQFRNISIDMFRKILDGTVRILSRQEVIDRTKVVIINNQTRGSGSDRLKYSSPEDLFTGLYLMDDDGTYLDNHSWFKKSGRYPSIPTVYQLADEAAKSFEVQVRRSDYDNRWSTIEDKVKEFNTLFPEEYTGDIYAGRSENGWVTYNPYRNGQTATGTIPFKYNTCDRLELSYSKYSLGVIKEFSDKLTFYLTNYDNADTSLKTDIIKIYGSSSKPTFTFTDRADHQASTVEENWTENVYTLTVTHNGPLDLTVNCSGSATDRLTSYTEAVVTPPAKPGVYYGPRQYEAECFEYKNINDNRKNGVGGVMNNYTGQGYIIFGTNSSASIRTNVNVVKAESYLLKIRYSVPSLDVKTIDLYINGVKATTPVFAKTERGEWEITTHEVRFNEGDNIVELRSNKTGEANIFFDNIVIEAVNPDSVEEIQAKDLIVVAEEYYTLMGQKIYNPEPYNLKGFYVVRSIMSDGSVQARKIYLK